MAKILEIKNISKKYGTAYANKGISITIESGKVYSLLGENGAGKSTLMNMLYGLTEPTEGEIFIDGKKVGKFSPKRAIANGIGMVHQHFKLIPTLTVLENIALSVDKSSSFWVKNKEIEKNVLELSARYGFKIDPYKKIADLSVGQQQRVEIIKAIYHDCRVLILDEPTAVLTPSETKELYTIIERFKKEDKSVIFISHKLNEVMYVSDEICVLRSGELVATRIKEETTIPELTALMVGKDVEVNKRVEQATPGETVLKIENLTVNSKKGHIAVNQLSLEVRAGEIYGIAGVDGNGQSELVEVIAGLRKCQDGSIYILGDETTNTSSTEILKKPISHIPADRQHMGIMMDKSLIENLVLYDYRDEKYCNKGFVNWKKAYKHGEDMVAKYNVKTSGLKEEIKYLSGGNQQKAVVARELEKSPRLLLAIHPTRGVDIGAIEFIHEEIVKVRDEGCAVLLVSTELEEVLALSNKIGVIYEGEILGELINENIDIDLIGQYMAGVAEIQKC